MLDIASTPSAPAADRLQDAPVPDVLSISGHEMSRLTGIGRERLRTWERRHGFPVPVRTANGQRGYRAQDVRVIVAVARLVDRGLPLSDAIERALQDDHARPLVDGFGAALDHADPPAIALAGPTPLTITWCNAATITAPEGPSPGDDLLAHCPGFSPVAIAAIQRMMSGPQGTPAVITHQDWTTPFPTECRSLAWRLSPEVSDTSVVVLIQLPADEHQGPAADDAAAWVGALRGARAILEQDGGVVAVQRAAGELARATGALDAFVTTSQHGQLRAASSVRGMWEARTLELDASGDAWSAIHNGHIDWLAPAALRSIGAPARSQVLVVPMTAGGHTLGALFVMYPNELRLCDTSRELLHGFGNLIAASLQRERHMAQLTRRRLAA